MVWLLDTNVLSELRRPKPAPRAVDFVASCSLDQLYVGTVTLAEIRFGIELVDEPNRRASPLTGFQLIAELKKVTRSH